MNQHFMMQKQYRDIPNH